LSEKAQRDRAALDHLTETAAQADPAGELFGRTNRSIGVRQPMSEYESTAAVAALDGDPRRAVLS